MGREAPDPPEAAAHPAVVARSDGLGRVLDDSEPVPLRDLQDRRHVGDAAGQVHRHDGLGLGRDGRLDELRSDVLVVAHVDEDRPGAELHDGGRRGDEGVGRGDHLVAGPDPERGHAEDERVRAGIEGDRMGDAAEPRQGALQLFYMRAADPVALGQHLLKDRQQRLALLGPLGGHVDVRDQPLGAGRAVGARWSRLHDLCLSGRHRRPAPSRSHSPAARATGADRRER